MSTYAPRGEMTARGQRARDRIVERFLEHAENPDTLDLSPSPHQAIAFPAYFAPTSLRYYRDNSASITLRIPMEWQAEFIPKLLPYSDQPLAISAEIIVDLNDLYADDEPGGDPPA